MSIILEQLTKRYDDLPVVNHVSLEVADREFFVLLGPSGSGKSTMLRLIAGLTPVDEGRVLLHGRDVTMLPPQQRGVGFVFQHYALFRHMSVTDNIEFGLRIRKVGAAERRRRRTELLDLVGLAGLGDRMPRQLSGGQQQRVALARALAYGPEVLLLDEPFGALDAKIRVEVRRTVKQIQRELGVTTIFVTHDQEEAFELADRVGVMNVGRLLEAGPPKELYQRPQTEFVASFLGTANLLVGSAKRDGVQLGPIHFPVNADAPAGDQVSRVQVLFRPEDIDLAPTKEKLTGRPLGAGRVEDALFTGGFERLRLSLPPIAGVRAIAPRASFGGDFFEVEASRSVGEALLFPLSPGDKAWIGVRQIHALTHPGLSFLILTDGSPQAQPAVVVGGQLSRLAHARTTILGYGPGAGSTEELNRRLEEAREQIGSGLPVLEMRVTADALSEALRRERERHHDDLIIAALPPHGGPELAGEILRSSETNLLLIPRVQPTPSRALICVTPGEPGKEDIGFAARFVRHLGAAGTLLSVLANGGAQDRARAERFVAAGARTLAALGVQAETVVRSGPAPQEILAQMAAGRHDLLVLGAPLDSRARRATVPGIVGQLLAAVNDYPVMIVPSMFRTQRRRRSTR